MTKGKKVKAIDSPSFLEPITLQNIRLSMRVKRTQQKLVLIRNISVHTLNKIENGFDRDGCFGCQATYRTVRY